MILKKEPQRASQNIMDAPDERTPPEEVQSDLSTISGGKWRIL